MLKIRGMSVDMEKVEEALKDEQKTGYENTPKITIEEIETKIKNNEILKDDLDDYYDRVYELEPEEYPGRHSIWGRCKRAIRYLKDGDNETAQKIMSE